MNNDFVLFCVLVWFALQAFMVNFDDDNNEWE